MEENIDSACRANGGIPEDGFPPNDATELISA